MRWLRWLRFFRRRQWDGERAAELDAYLEQETADNIARGMSAADARRAAHARLGNPAQIREEIYRMNSLGWIETVWQDVRYAWRALLKNPGFTAVALLSLALGVGASTAIFSVVYGVLISPYPYAKPGEIWAPEVHDLKNPKRIRGAEKMRDYVEIRKLPAFRDAMATLPESRLLTGGRGPENFTAPSLTANAFQFLGVAPVIGRTIMPSDIRADGQAEPVIVLSYKAWQRLFDGKDSALGQTMTLNDQAYTVIGVMPPRFGWFTDTGGWLAMPEDARDNRNVLGIFRLREGLGPKTAEAQLQALHLRLADAHPDDYPRSGFTTRLANYLDVTSASGEMESSLRTLFGAVGFLLLIACANVANLQLARGTARAQEIAVRMSIGAGRGRLLRQLLTESMALAAAGGALGVLLALGLTRAVGVLMPESYVPNEARVAVNGYALAFTAAVSILTGILFGLAPAVKCSRPNLVDALKDAGRVSGAGAGGRVRQMLVVAEIALSAVLLMGASLTARQFVKMQATDVGFRADRVLMLGLPLSPKRYATYEQRRAFAERALVAVSDLPGVQSAAIGNGGMPFGGGQSTYSIGGQRTTDARLLLNLVSADYAQTLGIPLRAGRALTRQEVARAEPLALINESASKLWPAGTSAIGKQIHLDLLEHPGAVLTPEHLTPEVTIVGILADTRNAGLRSPTDPAVYLPYTMLAPPARTLAVRTSMPPLSLLSGVRERIRGIDAEIPLNRPLTLEDILGLEVEQPRFNMAVFGFFGFLGLALAAVGIYSMLLQRGAADARDRHPHGAGGGARGGALTGAVVGREADGDRDRAGACGKPGAGARAAQRGVRSARHRRAGARGSDRAAGSGGARGMRDSGAARGETRSDACAAAAIGTAGEHFERARWVNPLRACEYG